MIGYAVGIATTFAVMVAWNHAQPALLFLVPSCTFSVIIRGFLYKQLDELSNYDEENIRKLTEKEEVDKKVT